MESSLEEIDERVNQVLDILKSKKYAKLSTDQCTQPLNEVLNLAAEITGEWQDLLDGGGAHRAAKSRDHIFHIEIETQNVLEPHFTTGKLAQELDGADLRNCQMYLNRIIDIAHTLEGQYREVQREAARVRLARRRESRKSGGPPAPGTTRGAAYE